MNIDAILKTLNDHEVDYLLIGGVNFLLHHAPELTFDVDVWVADNDKNLVALNTALKELGAEWGPTEQKWGSIPNSIDWLKKQSCYCLTTREGALDIFREVRGLEDQYTACVSRSRSAQTASGISYRGLSDSDMLTCQEALEPGLQKKRRMETLKKALNEQQK